MQEIPEGPEATRVTETYHCTDSPESASQGQFRNAWVAGTNETLERLDQVCTTQEGKG